MTKGGKKPYGQMKSRKPKAKPQAPLTHDPNSTDPDPKTQFKVEKVVEDDKKVKPKQVFENYSEPAKQGGGKGVKKGPGRPKGSKNKDKK